jgi:pantoate--beta-alanine ligase
MKIVTNADELRSDTPCAFVPTMGALHPGHVSLVTKARQYSDRVVMSIFVNPLQFENPDDLAKYPRTPDRDIALAEAAGVSELWLPRVEDIYPGEVKKVLAGPLGDLYEGASRPGHFDGVLTVVTRLFELVKPKWAIFGEKDFQQLTLVRTLESDVEIIAAPTVREEDGLALSSRNVRLGEYRASALVISRALFAASKESSLEAAQIVLDEILATESGFTRDYAEIIDDKGGTKRAIIAGWVNGVRLIDNMTMAASK